MVKLSSRKVSKYQLCFFFFLIIFSATIWHICAELNNYMGRKEARATTCLDTCRMLSISSTGNVVCLNGRGKGVCGGGEGSSRPFRRDPHFRGFCKWKRSGSSSPDTPHRWRLVCWKRVDCGSRNMRLFARMPALNHFPAPLSLLCSLRVRATRVPGWDQGSILLWEGPPAVLVQFTALIKTGICLKCFGVATHVQPLSVASN